VIVEEAEMGIKSLEVQLVRVETIIQHDAQAREGKG